ncbi:hypothetical protein PPERSA_05283 [Pseudocohnilembus persalinus]|uniref:Ribosomal eL28/Mak16 domain-containing protein n=1 Tax=Pseudocohnilembus persalinus TaxID=266149 RepID=A0A0V0R5Z6_PSEPJ|nr:hypothetical protein PPERSA_05283 [Pseudocohnilembus persalinus]|eukprot:KRX09891.1 hypothetical protein PPERSA_05283 [Pseudocohnilembus persalinus]
MSAPQSLVWELVKNNNAYRVVRNGKVWTTDAFSNTGVQTQSGLGFIQKQAVAIQNGSKQGQFQVRALKRTRVPNKQAVSKNSNKLAKTNFFEESLPIAHGVHTASKVIRKKFAHRQGLQKQALRKLVHLNKAGFRRQNAQNQEKKQQKQ